MVCMAVECAKEKILLKALKKITYWAISPVQDAGK